MSDKLLSEITEEDVEYARKLIEDELIEMRDSGLFMIWPGYVGNGLVVKTKEGHDDARIRMRTNECIAQAIKHILDRNES